MMILTLQIKNLAPLQQSDKNIKLHINKEVSLIIKTAKELAPKGTFLSQYKIKS